MSLPLNSARARTHTHSLNIYDMCCKYPCRVLVGTAGLCKNSRPEKDHGLAARPSEGRVSHDGCGPRRRLLLRVRGELELLQVRAAELRAAEAVGRERGHMGRAPSSLRPLTPFCALYVPPPRCFQCKCERPGGYKPKTEVRGGRGACMTGGRL